MPLCGSDIRGSDIGRNSEITKKPMYCGILDVFNTFAVSNAFLRVATYNSVLMYYPTS